MEHKPSMADDMTGEPQGLIPLHRRNLEVQQVVRATMATKPYSGKHV